MHTVDRPRYPTRKAQLPWQTRRAALLAQLLIRERAVNRSWCPKIGPGLAGNTEGADLQRLIDEGLAKLVGRGGGGALRQRLPNGELTAKRRGISTAKRVILTEAGKTAALAAQPAAARTPQPWAKRRADLAAGLA